MGSYRSEWRQSVRKDMRRITPRSVRRIVSAVEQLALDPFPKGCSKLTNTERAFRIRVGEYRVVYEIIDHLLVVEVVKVGHRRDVYR